MQVSIAKSLRSPVIKSMFSMGLYCTFKGVFIRAYWNGNSRKLTWVIIPKDEVGEYIFDKWRWNPSIYLQKHLRDFFSFNDYTPGSQVSSAASSLKMVLMTAHNDFKHAIKLDQYLGVSYSKMDTLEVEYKHEYNFVLVLHKSSSC